MILSLVTVALAAGLALPPGEPSEPWADALALAGLGDGPASVRVRVENGEWVLVAASDGHVRTARVPVPTTPRGREDVALLAASLLRAGPIVSLPDVPVPDDGASSSWGGGASPPATPPRASSGRDAAADTGVAANRPSPPSPRPARPPMEAPAARALLPVPAPSPVVVPVPIPPPTLPTMPTASAPAGPTPAPTMPTMPTASAPAGPTPAPTTMPTMPTAPTPGPASPPALASTAAAPAPSVPIAAPTMPTMPTGAASAPPVEVAVPAEGDTPAPKRPLALAAYLGPTIVAREGLEPALGFALGGVVDLALLDVAALGVGVHAAGSLPVTPDVGEGALGVTRAAALVELRGHGLAGPFVAAGPAVTTFLFDPAVEATARLQVALTPGLAARAGAGWPLGERVRVELSVEGGTDLRRIVLAREGVEVDTVGALWGGFGASARFR